MRISHLGIRDADRRDEHEHRLNNFNILFLTKNKKKKFKGIKCYGCGHDGKKMY